METLPSAVSSSHIGSILVATNVSESCRRVGPSHSVWACQLYAAGGWAGAEMPQTMQCGGVLTILALPATDECMHARAAQHMTSNMLHPSPRPGGARRAALPLRPSHIAVASNPSTHLIALRHRIERPDQRPIALPFPQLAPTMLSAVRARLQGRLLMASMTRSFSSLPAEVEEVRPGDSEQLGLPLAPLSPEASVQAVGWPSGFVRAVSMLVDA